MGNSENFLRNFWESSLEFVTRMVKMPFFALILVVGRCYDVFLEWLRMCWGSFWEVLTFCVYGRVFFGILGDFLGISKLFS